MDGSARVDRPRPMHASRPRGRRNLRRRQPKPPKPAQERKRSDNILPKLLASPRNPEELFQQELAKYDDLVAEVEANASKQAQLLAAVRTAQARFKEDHGYEDWRRACQVRGAEAGVCACVWVRVRVASCVCVEEGEGCCRRLA